MQVEERANPLSSANRQKYRPKNGTRKKNHNKINNKNLTNGK